MRQSGTFAAQLLKNSRKTECGAKQLLSRFGHVDRKPFEEPVLIEGPIVSTMAHGQQGREATHRRRACSKRDDSGRVLSEAQPCGHDVRLLAAHSKDQAQIGGDRRGSIAHGGITLVLGNGRRIESSWTFAEADLLRLIRAAEA